MAVARGTTTVDMTERFWTDETIDDAEPVTLVMAARRMIVARRALQASLPVEFLHDATLDILLALFVAGAEDRTVDAEAVAAATTVAPGVAGRWTAVLVEEGLVAIEAKAVVLTAVGRERVAEAIRAVIHSQVELHVGH
jgi:hypothetical protein